MLFFTDTNVPIAYTIIHDKWHENATGFISNHEQEMIFWSTLVKKEYGEKLEDTISELFGLCKTIA